MTLEPQVFKAYDIRGLYPSELDEEGAYAVGRGYVEEFEPTSIAVGRDMRRSSPAMAAAVVVGALEGGADVVDVGMIGTEMLYYAVGALGLDGGVTVTASHNPKDYTGMKIVRRGALPVGGDSGLLEVKARAERGFGVAAAGHSSRNEDIYPGWVARVLAFVEPERIAPLRVVVDAANGMAGAMLPRILDRLPVAAVRCFFEPDGTFPNHEPNPLLPENREFIVAKVHEEEADLGIAFDGDADRCFFVDDTGEFVPGDFVTALLAEAILAKEPGGTILYDVRASWAVPDAVERAGGTALVNRVGHAFIKHRMRKEDAVFAGEVSGHYYFRDYFQADSGVVPMLLLLGLVSQREQPLSEILAPFRERYFLTGEINTPVPDVAVKLQELKEHFAREGKVSHLDGISVTAADWHMNVRPSNTEPLLRLNLEALSRETMERKRDEVLELIPELSLELGRVTDRRPPFKYAALARVGFSDTDAQGIVYYGRYLPFFDTARFEYLRHLGLLRGDLGAHQFVMRASSVEYHAPARFDDLLEVYVRTRRIGRSSVTSAFAVYRTEDQILMCVAEQTLVFIDVAARRPAPVPERYRAPVRAFEGADLEEAA